MINHPDDLNDSLDDLLGGPAGEVRQPTRAPVDYKPAVERWEERCLKCSGTGRTRWGTCFQCKGAGKKTFKTSPQARAQARTRTAQKAVDKGNEAKAWREAHKVEVEWIERNAARQLSLPQINWDFPVKLAENLNKYGSLFDSNIEAVRKCIARDAARAAERAAAAPVVDTAGIDRLKAGFDKAIEYSREKGLKLSPKITIGGMTIKPAKATSANPGALYVTAGQTYLGKIAQGRFFASRDCLSSQTMQVQSFIADPAQAAKVYGQTTGTCCICNATLTSEWKLRGIGPICAEKFGW